MAAVAMPADRQPIYRPRGPDPLRTLFRRRFPDLQVAYEKRYASTYGTFRLTLITRAASAFRVCGDWSQGIARTQCTSCGFDRHDTFFDIPLGATAALIEIRRRRAVQWPALGVVALFLKKGLPNPDFARTIPAWQHAGFSIERGTRSSSCRFAGAHRVRYHIARG